MDPLEAILTSAVKIAQECLTEISPISIPSIQSRTARKSKWFGQRDSGLNSEDEDTDKDLLVFAQFMKRRRNNDAANDSEPDIMPDQSLMYPTVSLLEPETAVVGKGPPTKIIASSVKNHTTKTADSSNMDTNHPFLLYLQQCPDLTFETQFKLTRSTYHALLSLIRRNLDEFIVPNTIDAAHSLLISLWLLISSENSVMVADRFNVSEMCSQMAYDNVCKAMAIMSSQFVQWPDASGVAATVIAFNRVAVPGIIGVIGCTRFPEKSPKKGVSLQAACDHTGMFVNTELFIGIDRTNADLFATSRLRGSLVANEMLMPPSCHLAGNRSYPLSRFLMVPYKESDSEVVNRHLFNDRLASSTKTIDGAFVRLRERFSKLKKGAEPIQGVPGDLRRFVNTAVMLHNFCIRQKDSYWLDDIEPDGATDEVISCPDELTSPGVANKRNLLATRIKRKA